MFTFVLLPSTSCLLLQIALGSGDAKMVEQGSWLQGVPSAMDEAEQ